MLPTNNSEGVCVSPSAAAASDGPAPTGHLGWLDVGDDNSSDKNVFRTSSILIPAILSNKDDSTIIDLVNQGHDVNDKFLNKVPVLILALKLRKSDDVIKCIMAAGADLTATDDNHNTALIWALVRKRHNDVIRQMVRSGVKASDRLASPSLMLLALKHSASEATIKTLIEAGADVTTKDEKNRSPLWLALYRERSDIVVMSLLAAGTDVTSSINTGFLESYSPLMMAMDDCRSLDVTGGIVAAGEMPRLQRYSCTLDPPPHRRDLQMPHLLKVKEISPLVAALALENPELVKMFVEKNFLISFDVSVPRDVKAALLKHLESRTHRRPDTQDTHDTQDTQDTHDTDETGDAEYRTQKSRECLALAHQVLNQPWSLWTVSFVKVSTSLGFESDRRDKLTRTGLPVALQKQLMFATSN